MKTLHPYPGKFEGNESQLMAEVVYNASLDGCESTGDVQETFWYGRIRGKRYGFILTEDSQGFVDVTSYSLRDPVESPLQMR